MDPSISVVVYGNQVINEVHCHPPDDKKGYHLHQGPEKERPLKQSQGLLQAAWALEPWDLGGNMVLHAPVVRKYSKRTVRRERNHLYAARVIDTTHQDKVEVAFTQWEQRKNKFSHHLGISFYPCA